MKGREEEPSLCACRSLPLVEVFFSEDMSLLYMVAPEARRGWKRGQSTTAAAAAVMAVVIAAGVWLSLMRRADSPIFARRRDWWPGAAKTESLGRRLIVC